MKLHIKYNFTDLEHAKKIAEQTAEYADVLGIGSLLIYHYGIEAVTAFKKMFQDKLLFVDAKITDRAEASVKLFAQAGATYISVLAGSYKNIIRGATQAANQYKVNVLLDCADAYSLGESAKEAEALGIHGLIVHRVRAASHEEGDLETIWHEARDNTKLPIIMRGKLDHSSLPDIIKLNPNGIMIGEAITYADNPAQEAQAIKALMR